MVGPATGKFNGRYQQTIGPSRAGGDADQADRRHKPAVDSGITALLYMSTTVLNRQRHGNVGGRVDSQCILPTQKNFPNIYPVDRTNKLSDIDLQYSIAVGGVAQW